MAWLLGFCLLRCARSVSCVDKLKICRYANDTDRLFHSFGIHLGGLLVTRLLSVGAISFTAVDV